MNLKDLTLGAPAAERDIKRDPSRGIDFTRGLLEYFVESDTYRSVQRGATRILIGNRGSGKSAIFQVLAARERKQGTVVIEFAPTDYSYDHLGTILKKELAGNWGKQGAYAIAWKRVLYVAAMKELAGRATNVKSKALKRIKSYLSDNYSGFQEGIAEQLVSFMKRLEALKIGDFSVSLRTRELQDMYKLAGIEELLPDLTTLCEGRKVIILVDELDRGWDGSEDARAFVAGLFAAATSMNALTQDFQVLISLRRELYDNIPAIYEDAQKVRDLLRYVEWDEDGLRDLIERRIAAALGIRSWYVRGSWEKIFVPEMADGESTFKYIIERTLYRPREIIQFCTQCIEKASPDSATVDEKTIRSAELVYSRDRAQDIAQEYRFEYPGLDEILETFRGLAPTMSRGELELHCLRILTSGMCPKATAWLSGKDERALIDALWRVGFLMAHVNSDESTVAGEPELVLGPHQVATLNLETASAFTIHKMFRRHLGIRGSSVPSASGGEA